MGLMLWKERIEAHIFISHNVMYLCVGGVISDRDLNKILQI